MAILKFKPYSPWFPMRIPSVFDEEEQWPEIKVTEGLEVYETENDVVVKAAVPGIPADKVNVTFEDGVLRIQASSEETKEEKEKKKVIYKQQRMSSFDYTTTLPRAVDGNKISAEVSEGVITVKAPITLAAKAKKITVKSRNK